MKNEGRRVPDGFAQGDLTHGIFLWQRRYGDGDTPFLPICSSKGADGSDRSFITRDFNRGCGKENGTIPF
jgi:hypothetical protein